MKISSDFLICMKIYTVVLTVLIQLHFFQIKRRASMRQCMDAENLHRRLKKILEGHIKHCVRDGIEHGDADKTIDSFTKAVERFANMT